MAVQAKSDVERSKYTFVPSSDSIRARGHTWEHSGATSGGSAFVWTRGIAHYTRDEGGLPSATITVQVWGDSPADRPLEGRVTIPVK
ncbi:hypothetical protein HNR17_002400 [Galbitalea soli]|nr:hypothetical protein [Galbitalea soli]